jgi:hypothetical protein
MSQGAGPLYVLKPDYAEAVKEAEAAVASIKDTELKGIAFGKILDALLGPHSPGRGAAAVAPRSKIRSEADRKRNKGEGWT